MACALGPVSDFRLDREARRLVCVNFKIVFTALLGRCNFKAASGSTNIVRHNAKRTGDAQAELRNQRREQKRIRNPSPLNEMKVKKKGKKHLLLLTFMDSGDPPVS